MIRSFKSKDTEALFRGVIVPELQNLRKVAYRHSVDMLSSADVLFARRAAGQSPGSPDR